MAEKLFLLSVEDYKKYRDRIKQKKDGGGYGHRDVPFTGHLLLDAKETYVAPEVM